MNEGEVATRLGLRGIPSAAETIMLERDIRLVELVGRPLSRGPNLLPRLARHHPHGEADGLARHLRRVDQPPHAERERHRPLPHLLQDEAAAPVGGRSPRHGRRRGERRYRRDRLGPRSARRRGQAPPLCRGRRRRRGPRDLARRRASSLPQRRDRAWAALASAHGQSGAACSSLAAAGSPRARRPISC